VYVCTCVRVLYVCCTCVARVSFCRSCQGADSLVAFVHIDGKKDKIDSFCGETPPRPIMSNGPRLSLEFQGVTSSRYSRGFKATYSFMESKCRLKAHRL